MNRHRLIGFLLPAVFISGLIIAAMITLGWYYLGEYRSDRSEYQRLQTLYSQAGYTVKDSVRLDSRNALCLPGTGDIDRPVQVFLDPGLQLRLPADLVPDAPNRLCLRLHLEQEWLKPLRFQTTNPARGTSPTVSWGALQVLYLRIENSLDTGQMLPKPVVQAALVAQGSTRQATLKTAVIDSGEVSLHWDYPDPARSFEVLVMRREAWGFTPDNPSQLRITTAGTTDANSFIIPAEGNRAGTVNQQFSVHQIGEDEQYIARSRNDEPAQKYANQNFGAVAASIISTDEDGQSRLVAVHLLDHLVSKIPLYLSPNYPQNLYAANIIYDMVHIPQRAAVVMADGSLKFFPVFLLPNSVKPADENLGEVSVTAQIQGSGLTAEIIMSLEPADFQGEIRRFNQRVKQTVAGRGRRVKMDRGISPILRPTSVSRPAEIAFPHSNELSKFIGSSAARGNTVISLSGFEQAEDASRVIDAALEASYQNSGQVYWWPNSYDSKRKILYLSFPQYEVQSARSQQLLSTAKQVAAQIFSATMTPRQRVEAINEWLIENVEYNYDAEREPGNQTEARFTGAWSPDGVFIEHRAVCQGYAAAFNTLAALGGVDSILVTGDSNEVRHAWNKVRIDGEWTNVDSTWNATSGERDTYLFFPDNTMNHTQDTEWVYDSNISLYDANRNFREDSVG